MTKQITISIFKNNKWRLVLQVLAISSLISCGGNKTVSSEQEDKAQELQQLVDSLVRDVPGTVGVAVITSEGDTVAVNNDVRYPLMSVFKVHEALAVAHELDSRNQSLDSIMTLQRSQLSETTWSPMLKDYPKGDLKISVGELMRYILTVSDNNASNVLFDSIVSVSHTDSFIRNLGIPDSFRLQYTESQMQRDHAISYDNYSSPLSCAALVKRVFTDSIVSQEKQDSIRQWMGKCVSATDRMMAGVTTVDGARLYHRTGSGYTNERGEIIAINDVGYIIMPDGRETALAILVKDYPGEQSQADSLIASITSSILQFIR